MAAASNEAHLLEFLYACPIGLIECDAAGEIAMINPHAMQHLLPLAGSRDAGNLFAAFEQHAPEVRNMVAAFASPTGKICDGHRIFVDLGVGRRNTAARVLACTLVKLGPDRLMATLADISQQVVQEQRLRQADTWFATLLDGINDYAALTVTADGKIASADTSFTRQTGQDYADVIGRKLADALSIGAVESSDVGNGKASGSSESAGGNLHLDAQLAIAERDGWHLQEGWQQRASGERYWCQRLVVARSDDTEAVLAGFSVILRDVPRHDAAAQDLRRLLTCDHLTGASNRRHFGQAMERERAHWQELREPLSLVLLDLDHFKSVNDKYGHPIGDVLLCRVAEACTALLPPRGVFARLGGEEFGVLLPRYDQDQAMALAEELRQAISNLEVETSLDVLRTTASFGCATFDETEGSIEALLALADKRLYAAKRDGRNRVYHPHDLAA
jgi:diguanylate cyclase (GGDEF)-like protein